MIEYLKIKLCKHWSRNILATCEFLYSKGETSFYIDEFKTKWLREGVKELVEKEGVEVILAEGTMVFKW